MPARGWKPRSYKEMREELGQRIGTMRRRLEGAAVPTGVMKRKAIQRHIYPKPSVSRRDQDVKRYRKFKQSLMRRYDTDETNRRKELTATQHLSHTGKIGSEGFRKYTVITAIPHRRDRSPHWLYDGKERQYAFQNEFRQSKEFKDTASTDSGKPGISPYRYKRDDGTRPISAYRYVGKKQRVRSQVRQY